MKSFLVLFSKKTSSVLSNVLLDEHVKYLKKLYKDGNLLIYGPFIDSEGALLIIRADSESMVEKLIKLDPFIESNYYQEFTVREFTEANEQNNWLLTSNAI